MSPGWPAGHGGEGAGGAWLIERYEALRREALARRRAEAEGAWGRGLLVARGMAEWVRVSAAYVDGASLEPCADKASGTGLGPCLAPASSAQIVQVLAGWVWALPQREVHA